jgi:hypothetical protein
VLLNGFGTLVPYDVAVLAAHLCACHARGAALLHELLFSGRWLALALSALVELRS